MGLIISLFVFGCPPASADRVHLNQGDAVQGLVVEEHLDRIILSTVDGEKEILRKNSQSIDYDDPEYSFMNLARQMESREKWEEALSYYEKALQINHELKGAKEAALGIRSRIWAKVAKGASDEMTKRQEMHEAWRENRTLDDVTSEAKKTQHSTFVEACGTSGGPSGGVDDGFSGQEDI